MAIIFQGKPERGEIWRALFAAELPDLPFHALPDTGDPEAVTYATTWAPIAEIGRFPNLKVLFSSGAGVDQLGPTGLPESVSLVRMIEPGLAQEMAEYVTLATLTLHRDAVHYRESQAAAAWSPRPVRATASRTVGIMGLGEMGRAVLARLQPFGFSLRAWNRSPRAVEGVACFSGPGELDAFLSGCEILICLLPLTDETRGILSARLFDKLPTGAGLVNAGRGGHLVEADLVPALDSGRLSAAILDVTAIEPTPPDHPFWRHPGIVLTPHIASMAHPEGAGRMIVENVRRHRAGEPMIGLVDRTRGY